MKEITRAIIIVADGNAANAGIIMRADNYRFQLCPNRLAARLNKMTYGSYVIQRVLPEEVDANNTDEAAEYLTIVVGISSRLHR